MIETLESRLFLSTSSNDTRAAEQWALSAVAANDAWDVTTGATSVIVAGIDTGVDYTHPDLYLNVWINQAEIPATVRQSLADVDADNRITFYDLNDAANAGKVTDVNKNSRIDAGDLIAKVSAGGWSDGVDAGKNGYVDDIVGWDFANNDNNPMDYDGHGTHTAGTIAATGNNGTGVAGLMWKASLMVLKIFSDRGTAASDAKIAAAIRYSADNGAKVSNNSWGSSYYSSALYNAVKYAGTKGQIFVVAAGNDAWNIDSTRYGSYPAEFNLDNVISVAATTSSGSLASYSNYGKTTVDIAAPGSSVLSTVRNGGYASYSGTSMATPQVSGAVALMMAANPTLSASQIKSRLIAGADQSASLLSKSVSGGELNVANAINGVTGQRVTTTASSSSTSTTTPVAPPPRFRWPFAAGRRFSVLD